MHLPILEPIEHQIVKAGRRQAIDDISIMLIEIEENMSINLRLAKNELKQFEIFLILDKDVNRFIAPPTLF